MFAVVEKLDIQKAEVSAELLSSFYTGVSGLQQ